MAFSKISLLAKLDTVEGIAADDPFPVRTEPVVAQVGGSQAIGTYNFSKMAKIVIAGGANTTLDLWAAMTSHGGSAIKTNPTKLRGYYVETSGVEATASLLFKPGASTPAPLSLVSSTPAAETPGILIKAGGGFALISASFETLSTSLKSVYLGNPGSTDITVIYGFILGGGTDS